MKDGNDLTDEKRELKMRDICVTSTRHVNVDLSMFTPTERVRIIDKFNEDRWGNAEDIGDGTITFTSYELDRLTTIINDYERERISEVR